MRSNALVGALTGAFSATIFSILASELGRSVTHIPLDHPKGDPWHLFIYNGYLFAVVIGAILGAIHQWSSAARARNSRAIRFACVGMAVGFGLLLIIFELSHGVSYSNFQYVGQLHSEVLNSDPYQGFPAPACRIWLSNWTWLLLVPACGCFAAVVPSRGKGDGTLQAEIIG